MTTTQPKQKDVPQHYNDEANTFHNKEDLEQFVRTIFSELDLNGNGYIDANDLLRHKDLRVSQMWLDEYKKALAEGDDDGDGKVDFEEFRRVFLNKNVQ